MMILHVVVVVVFVSLLLLSSHPQLCASVLLVNVGLPRTGTTSVHKAVPLFNFSSNHVAFQKTRFDLESQSSMLMKELRQNGTGLLADLLTQFDAFSDTPCYGAIGVFKTYFQQAKIIATWRSKESWLDSLRRNPQAGGNFLTGVSGLRKGFSSTNKTLVLAHVWDNHNALLEKYGIPKLDIAANSQEKHTVLLDNLPSTPVTRVARKCLEQDRLKWPDDNKGHMNTKGCNRIIPNMSKGTLRNLAETCNFEFEYACREADVVYPTDRHPGNSYVHHVSDFSA